MLRRLRSTMTLLENEDLGMLVILSCSIFRHNIAGSCRRLKWIQIDIDPLKVGCPDVGDFRTVLRIQAMALL